MCEKHSFNINVCYNQDEWNLEQGQEVIYLLTLDVPKYADGFLYMFKDKKQWSAIAFLPCLNTDSALYLVALQNEMWFMVLVSVTCIEQYPH